MKKTIFAQMFAVVAFAFALPMMAIDVEKELVPLIPEGTNVIVGADFPAILEAPLTKKYLPDYIKLVQDEARMRHIPYGSSDCIEKVDKALASQNLTRADFKDVFVVMNVEKEAGYLVFFTKATLANMKVMSEAMASEGETPEYKDTTVAGYKAIRCVEEGHSIVIAEVKKGVLIMSDEFGIEAFAIDKKIAPSAPIVQKFPKIDCLVKFSYIPSQRDPLSPKIMSGCIMTQGENIDIEAKLGFVAADSARMFCEQVDMQFRMFMGMMMGRYPKLAQCVEKAFKIGPDGSDVKISIVLSSALIDAYKEFQAKEAAARACPDDSGMKTNKGTLDK